jgi:hypothetical protein
MEALRLYTVGSSWFSSEDGKKGAIAPGQYADLAVLSEDYFSIPEERIKSLESVLTIMGGKPVYGAEEFTDLSPPALPIMPEWSPIAAYGGYSKTPVAAFSPTSHICTSVCAAIHQPVHKPACNLASSAMNVLGGLSSFWGSTGCACFAF